VILGAGVAIVARCWNWGQGAGRVWQLASGGDTWCRCGHSGQVLELGAGWGVLGAGVAIVARCWNWGQGGGMRACAGRVWQLASGGDTWCKRSYSVWAGWVVLGVSAVIVFGAEPVNPYYSHVAVKNINVFKPFILGHL
jgi:hypothetical protein